MSEKTEEQEQTTDKPSRRILSFRAMVMIAGGIVVILGLVIGLNVGGLREELLWRISPPRIESIAVLPFENLSRDPEQEYFADGMTAELANKLAHIGTFRVISHTSVIRYRKAPKPLPEIARELGIHTILEGGVLRSDDRVRIVTSLVHAPTARYLWGKTYERELQDISVLQAEISRAIALEIKAELTPEVEARLRATNSVKPEAYDAYLRGMYGQESGKSDEYLMQAIKLDPAYAPAYAALAGNYYWPNYFAASAPRDTYPRVKEAAQKTLAIDPTLADSHYYLALVAQEYDWNFVKAEEEFRRALELNPNAAEVHHLYSHFLLCMGRQKESGAEDRHAEEIDPLNSTLIACLGWHSVVMGKHDEAEERCRQALSMGTSDWVRLFLGWSYEQRGLYDQAILELQKAVVGFGWGGTALPTAALGHTYAAASREQEAREVLDRLLARSKKEYVSPYEIAAVYAGLGDRARSFEWLQRAYEERSNSLVRFRMDPRLRDLQSDARFQELLRRMNFLQARQN